MLKRVIIGVIIQFSHITLLLIYCFAFLWSIIDYMKVKRKNIKKLKCETFRNLAGENAGYIECEKKSYKYIFKTLGFQIVVHLIYSISFFVLLYNLDTEHNGSWYEFFFDFSKKKSNDHINHDKYFLLYIFIIYLIWTLSQAVFRNVIISIYVTSFTTPFTVYLKHLFPILEENISIWLILTIMIIFSFLNLIINYTRLYSYIRYAAMNENNLSDKCNDKMAEHFDYIGIDTYYPGINCINGPIGNKQCIVFLGDVSIFTDDEAYSVILHEIGHGGNLEYHTNYLIELLLKLLVISFYYFLCKSFSKEFFDNSQNLTLFFFISFLPVIIDLNSLFYNLFGYSKEIASDDYAIEEGYGLDLIRGLFKMSIKNGSTCKMNYLTNLLISTHPCEYLRAVNYEKKVKKINKT